MHTDDIENPNATRAALAIVAVVFALLILAGPLTYALVPEVKTQATPPFPAWSTKDFLDGKWTEALRRHLRESSILTVLLRGVHSEAEFLLGTYRSPAVAIGRGGMLFMRGNTVPKKPGIAQQQAARRAVFRDVAAWAASRDVHIVVAVPPDKARIYADHWAPSGELPAARRGEYAALLAEIRDAGLPVVDLAAPFFAWRRARPAEPLYQERDTHWNRRGSLLAALAIADRIAALGWADELGTPAPLVATPLQRYRSMPDLAGLLGFLPGGLLEDQFLQPQRLGALHERGATAILEPHEPSAKLALCGDSFSEVGLATALGGVLGREIDTAGTIPAGGPIRGLVETMRRIDRGELSARILVWEFVERAQAMDQWAHGPAVPETAVTRPASTVPTADPARTAK